MTALTGPAAPVPLRPEPSSAYVMRTLRTDAEREEAAALVQDRQRWLALRTLPVPAQTDVPALFRDPRTETAGLFEDGKLLACLVPARDPGLSWGDGPCLRLGHIHTLPGQSDDITRLITLWASDAAARLGLPLVRAEVLARQALQAEPIAALLHRFTDMGWDVRGSGPGRDGDQVARLELTAEHRPGLTALISCQTNAPQLPSDDRGNA